MRAPTLYIRSQRHKQIIIKCVSLADSNTLYCCENLSHTKDNSFYLYGVVLNVCTNIESAFHNRLVMVVVVKYIFYIMTVGVTRYKIKML